MAEAIEAWRAVPGYGGDYEVSNQGNVRTRPRVDAKGVMRKLRNHKPSRMDAWGHLGVKLMDGERQDSRYVHQLVLEAFVGPRPTGMVACHWNDVPDDNRLENLRWASPRGNRLDLIRNGHDHNLRKTHCTRGHPYDEANTLRYGGKRQCRTCQLANEAAYRARRAQKRKELA